jgi:hypothetical protein
VGREGGRGKEVGREGGIEGRGREGEARARQTRLLGVASPLPYRRSVAHRVLLHAGQIPADSSWSNTCGFEQVKFFRILHWSNTPPNYWSDILWYMSCGFVLIKYLRIRTGQIPRQYWSNTRCWLVTYRGSLLAQHAAVTYAAAYTGLKFYTLARYPVVYTGQISCILGQTKPNVRTGQM